LKLFLKLDNRKRRKERQLFYFALSIAKTDLKAIMTAAGAAKATIYLRTAYAQS
jgi:ABC-type thiamine transport system ATPase subunit